MSDIATLGFDVNTSGLTSGEAALDSFQKTGEKTEKKIATQSKKIGKSFGGVGRNAGMAGIQVQQFVGQLQGGQSAMVALAQQSADLGFVLGAPMAGVLVSIGAVLAGVLVPSLMNSKDAMEQLDEVSNDLKTTFAETSDGSLLLSKSIEKLAERSQALARLQISSSIVDAEKVIKISTEGIIDALDDLEGSFNGAMNINDAYEAIFKYSGALDELPEKIQGAIGHGGFAGLSAKLDEVGREFGVSRQSALEYIMVLGELKKDQSALSIKALENQLSKMNDETGGTSEKINELAKVLIPLFEGVTDGVDKVNLLRRAFADYNGVIKDSGEGAVEGAEALKRVTDSLKAQVVVLSEGKEAALAFGVAQSLGLESIKELPPEIQKLLEVIQKLKEENVAKSFFDETNASLDLQKQKLTLTAEEFEVYKVKMNAIASGVAPKLVEELVKITRENQKLKQSFADNKEFDKLISDVDKFGGAWSKTGSVVIDAFGDMSDALGDYMDRMEDIGALEKRVAEARIAYGDDNIDVIRLQNELNDERVSAELSGMKSLSAATGSLFAEKTAAAKAFAALNKVIAIAEIALSFQKMAAGTAETAVHVANETTKTGANALTAITSAFAAPFPVGFVAGAAMIGVMAGLLGSLFGGGGAVVDPTQARQDSQGTGTLLGSGEKSGSISNLQESFEDIQLDQLAELQGIRGGLSAIGSGIDLVTRSFISSNIGDGSEFEGKSQVSANLLNGVFGGERLIDKLLGGTLNSLVSSFVGNLFGKTRTEVVDSGILFIETSLKDIIDSGISGAQAYFDVTKTKKKLFGLISSSSTTTETQGLGADFERQISGIFANIGETVSSAAGLLGLDVAESIGNFQVDLGKISLEGLSGEEITEELNAVFGSAADSIAQLAAPSILKFQEVGEGAFETLVRVAKEQAIFNDQINNMGISLVGLSDVMKIDIAQSLISLTGGLEEFSSVTSSFIDNFFSDSDKLNFLESSLTDVFDSLGLSLVDSREGFKELVQGVDITTEEGQQLLATLLEINPALSEYIDELERVESERLDMTIQLLEIQGKSEEALAISRRLELEAMDESLVSLQNLIYAESERVQAIQDQEDAVRDSFSAIQQSVLLDKQRAQAILDVAAQARDSELSRVEDLRASLSEQQSLLQGFYSESEAMLRNSFLAEKERAKASLDLSLSVMNAELEKVAVVKQALSDQLSALTSFANASELALKSSISLEKERAKSVLNASELARNSEIERIGLVRAALDSTYSGLEARRDEVSSQLDRSFQSEIELIRSNSAIESEIIQSNASSRISSLNDERSAIESTASAMRSLVASINSSLGLSSSSGLIEALASARAGDFAPAQNLDVNSLANISSEGFSSAEDMAVQQALNKNRLSEIGDLAGGKVSDSERTINAINRQITSTENSSQAQIEAINTEAEIQIEELQKQLNALLGIDTSVLSIEEAIIQFSQNQEDIANLNYNDEIAALDEMVAVANASYDSQEAFYNSQISSLDEQLNAVLGLNETVLSVGEAIVQYQQAQQDLDSFNYAEQISALELTEEAAKAAYELQRVAYEEQIASLDSQLNALLGIDTSVLSLTESTIAYQESKEALDSFNYEQELEKLDMMVESANEVYALHEQAYADEITRLDQVISDNEALLNAALGIDNSVLSVAEAVDGLSASISALAAANEVAVNTIPEPTTENPKSNDDGVADFSRDIDPDRLALAFGEEIKVAAETSERLQLQVVKNTQATAKLLQRFEFDGLDTRIIP
jgi:hypothetical protein